MKPETTRKLFRWHYTAGLIFGANLIFLSLTGAILVFHDEIDALTHPETGAVELPAEPLRLDPVIAKLKAEFPEYAVNSMGFAEAERPFHRIALQPTEAATAAAEAGGRELEHQIVVNVDPVTGATVAEDDHVDIMHIILHLHADLMLGRLGLLYLGIVSLALLFSSVTGLILYGPFMKQLAFGAIRRKSVNTTSTDLHKFVGLVSLGFQVLMAVTGACLTLGSFILQIYLYFELQGLPKSDVAVDARPASIDLVLDNSRSVFAERNNGESLTAVLYPGGLQGDDYFAVLAAKAGGLERFVPVPLLMDRATGDLVQALELPWYIKMLAIAQPFHFGNFGGLPMKILYFVLALTTGGLALTGYILWYVRRKKEKPVGPAKDGEVAA